MIGRGKSEGARPRALKEDMISQLPDSLICQILSLLSIKEAVKTSVLSTRWRHLWLWLPSLELNCRNFQDLNAFVSFGDRYFDSNRVSCIRNLSLTIDEKDESYLTSWIDALVKRKIQSLCVYRTGVCVFRTGVRTNFHEMPLSLYVCETLVFLTLSHLTLVDTEFVSLPCLKTLRLHDILFPNEATFERLVSSCPVLDDLTININNNDPKVYRVHSRSLRSLCLLRLLASLQFDSVPGVVIDAPQLCCLSINDDVSKSFIVNNLEPNAKLDLSLEFGLMDFDEASVSLRRSHIRSFLLGISSVKDMAISPWLFKIIHHYSKLELLPQFDYMSHLDVSTRASDLKWLPTFLEHFPNLKSLELTLGDYNQELSEEMSHISFSSVPECLLSSLEFVDFDIRISVYAAEMKLVQYFLENSAMLKKLTLRVNYESADYDLFEELHKIPRRSTLCQVVVVDD